MTYFVYYSSTPYEWYHEYEKNKFNPPKSWYDSYDDLPMTPENLCYEHDRCDTFAWAIHHITNWPIVKISPSEDERAHHWVCEIPGKPYDKHTHYFDINGSRPEQDVLDHHTFLLMSDVGNLDEMPDLYDHHSNLSELEDYNTGKNSTKSLGMKAIPYARQKLRQHGFNY